MNLTEKIAGRIIVDCGKGSEYPCPHDEPVMGYEKCLHEDKDICLWQLNQAEGIIQLIKKRLDSVELPKNDWQNDDMIRGWNIAITAYRKAICETHGVENCLAKGCQRLIKGGEER